MRVFGLLALVLLLPRSVASEPRGVEEQWTDLLERYVVDERWVDYEAWHASELDRAALEHVVNELAATDLDALDPAARLANWINLYNAVTVDLILDHYPLASIKDIDTGLLGSPWKIERVTADGRPLTLDQIEHEIIRVRFQEPRVHFALNCASVGCPPLAAQAYTGAHLDEQLEAATLRAITSEEWVDTSGCTSAYGAGVLRVTKLFDWFAEDFGGEKAVREFLAKRLPARRFPLQNTECALDYIDYDWALNAPPATRP